MISIHKLILGTRGCGKSEKIELEISNKFRQKVYVGTLWQSYKFTNLIETHRKRRGADWKLIEVCGNIQKDEKGILEVIKNTTIEACLIDGLTTWAIHCARLHGDIIQQAYDVAVTTANLASSVSNISWWFIDVVPEVFEVPKYKNNRIACELIHRKLHEILKNQLIINIFN